MKILFDVNHPAQAHLFRNFILYLMNRSDCSVTVTIRDKDITKDLLDHYQIPSIAISKPRPRFRGLLTEFVEKDFNLFKLNLKKRFDISFGTSYAIAHLSIFFNHRSFNFNEDDDDIVPRHANITYPFTTKIINPDCLEFSKWKNKRVLVPSYHELAYLHPDNFTPDQSILAKYNLQPYQFVIARFSALEAHHDTGIKGISQQLWEKIKKIISALPIVKSIEKSKTHQIAPWDMHHVLAYASMVVCDSQTMTAEAAVLGVPSVRINSFARKISYLKELEFKYGLTKSFLPNEEQEILAFIGDLVYQNFNLENYQLKRALMLADKKDFTKWMINYFNKELNA